MPPRSFPVVLLLVVAAVLAACGSADPTALAPATTTPAVGATPGGENAASVEATSPSDSDEPASDQRPDPDGDPEPDPEPTRSGPDLSGFDFPTPTEAPAAPPRPTPDVDRPDEVDPPTLDDLVFDEPPREEPSFDFDEAAAITCANLEFALDGLVEQDEEAFLDAVATAAEVAPQSTSTPISSQAAALAGVTGLADGESVVLSLLEVCSQAGYEL